MVKEGKRGGEGVILDTVASRGGAGGRRGAEDREERGAYDGIEEN